MQVTYLLIFAIVVALLIAVPILGFGKKNDNVAVGKTNLNKKFVQEKWIEIEKLVKLAGPSNFKAAIMESDKLVDYTLRGIGAKGETMGERLKNAKGRFSNYSDYDNLWFAHKVRNNIAHEASHELSSAEAKRAIEYYKAALKKLGVI